MIISVQQWNGDKFDLEVDATEYIDDIKDKIQELHKIPCDQQRLTCDGKDVDDVDNLEEQGIEEGSLLVLDKIQITIVLPADSGKSSGKKTKKKKKDVKVSLLPNYTIKKVKRMVAKKTGIDVDVQCLFLDKDELKDSKKLCDAKIEHNDSLIMELFTVNVAHWSGDIVEVPGINPHDSIEAVKKHIFETMDIPMEQQTYTFGGKAINEILGLRDLKVKHKSLLDLQQPEGLRKKEKVELSFFPQAEKKQQTQSEISISIKHWDGSVFTVSMPPSDYVDDLKEQIEKVKGIPVDYQTLSLDGEEIDDTLPLDEQEITNETTLNLENMKIVVALPSKKEFKLTIAYDATVRRIKRIVAKKAGIEIDAQVILFNDEEVQDKQTMSECGILNGYTVNVDTFAITISHWDGDITEDLRVSPNDTVEELKKLMFEKKEIPMEEQKYSFGDKVLNEFLGFKNQGIIHKSVLQLEKPVVQKKREKFKLQLFPATDAMKKSLGKAAPAPGKQVKLHIQESKSKTLEVEIDTSHYLDDLKEKIEKLHGISAGQQRLSLDGDLLEDDQTLAEQNIVDGATLVLEPMKIIIKLPNGKTFRMTVKGEDSMKKVKRAIAKKSSIDVSVQCLTFAGTELTDRQKVSSCGLEYESEVAVEQYTITVAHWLGDMVPITGIKPTDTVEELGQKIEEEMDVPISKQRFRFDGRPVNGFLALQDQQIKHKSILVMEDVEIVQSAQTGPEDTGKEIDDVDTIDDLPSDSHDGDDDDSVASWVGRYAMDEDYTSELTKVDTSNPDSWLSKVAAAEANA